MPELEIAPLPPVEPDAPQAPSGPKGTAAFVAQMDEMLGGGEPKPDENAQEQVKPKQPDKAPKAPEKVAAPEKPATPPPDKPTQPEREEKDPVKLRLAHKKLKEEYEGFKGSKTKELTELQTKLKTLESKRVWSADDETRVKALEQRISEREAELYARDYKASPEFKDKFATKWERMHKKAVEDVTGMQVKFVDGQNDDGSQKFNARPATEHDFERIRMLSGARADQRKMAKEMFGEDAGAVLEYTAQLKSIEEQANEEIANKRKNFDAEREKYAEQQRRYDQTFDNARSEVDRALQEKYPQFFGTNGDDTEGSAAFQKGLAFVDETLKIAGQIPPEDRAARNAIIRSWAGAFPRLALRVKKLEADLAAKDEELGKYRSSDPGSGGEGSGEPSGDDTPKTSADLANVFNKLND